MGTSIKDLLDRSGVLREVICPREIDLLLSALEPTGPTDVPPSGVLAGAIRLTQDLSQSPIPGFDFALTTPADVVQPAPFRLELSPAQGPTSFRFWLVLAEQGQARFIFKFVEGIAGMGLTGARLIETPEGDAHLQALPADDPRHAPVLVSRSPQAGVVLGPALLVAGAADTPANIRFTPDTSSTDGIVALGLEPPTVVFGSSKIGFDLPVLVIDDSVEAVAPGMGAPALDPPLGTIAADEPSWRGLLARQLDFYLPAEVPFFGGQPIKGYLAIPTAGGGANLVMETKVPARLASGGRGARPAYSVRIECLDPTASGLSGLLPTCITATMDLPLDGARTGFSETGGTNREITFAAGKPVRVTATLARDPVNAPGEFRISVGVAAHGQAGILSVTSTRMDGAKIFNTAAALATALIADKDVARAAQVGDGTGVVLSSLVAAGAALSSLLTDDSGFVLHGVEFESTGHGLPVGGPLTLKLDYSVAVRITKVDIGVLAVSMRRDQPMRIRVRDVRMSINSGQSGLRMIGLDFDRAQLEVENPGAWDVAGLESLFDVLGSRSGRGSTFIEVDLRFKLNLGPIRVSGATIRATLNDNGTVDATIRGLEAGLTVPGAIEGTGRIQLRSGGFGADLLARLLPLNLAVDAAIEYAPPMIVLRLGVDLPAPIPLANSGFGMFGVGGLFGMAAVPQYAPDAEDDPVLRQLQWQPTGVDSFRALPGQSSFGLEAVVGTLPDLGFSFSSKAGLLISVPDVAVRGALNGRVLQPRVQISEPSYPPPPGLSFLGFIGVDSTALSFAVLGVVDLKPLLEIRVPMAGHFPFKADSDDWYVYLGADGAPMQGRSIGPISAKVLPGILDVGADAYLMLRGRGIAGWPHGRDSAAEPLTIPDGFVAAFGFGVQTMFGVRPIAWAELFASLDLLLGTKPPTLAGFGRAGGSLHLGPFSLGVQATVNFLVREQSSYLWAQVTGRIELLFFDIEATVTLAFGDEPQLTMPDADRHPLDHLLGSVRDGSLGVLTDDSYRVLAPLVEDPSRITPEMNVWPDTIVSLPFAIAPVIGPDAGSQFPGILGPGAIAPRKVGSEMLWYQWQLDALTLRDVSAEPDPTVGGTVPPGAGLAASWQVPRIPGAGSSDVAELVLLSNGRDLWVNRLADAGEGRQPPVLKASADLCRRRVSAQPGWAVGWLAGKANPGFRLPPEPTSMNRLDSRVEATMRHFGVALETGPTALDEAFTMPPPFWIEPARLVGWPVSQEIKHLFHGHIEAPNLHGPAGMTVGELVEAGYPFVGQQIILEPAELILDGLLVLVAERELFDIGERFAGIQVWDDLGEQWPVADFIDLPTGQNAALLWAPSTDGVTSITVTFPIGVPLGVVGLGGVTVNAWEAAKRENDAIASEVSRLQQATAQGPKTDPSTNSPHERTILSPGRLYRIDVDMSWSGEISKQDESGQIVVAATRSDETTYTPQGSATALSTRRQLFFRTAPVPQPQPPPSYGLTGYLPWLFIRQDVFQPEMLERYLGGYEPAQSEECRFCDDPLRAHFRQDHVAALAKTYGFDLRVAVRRLDRPGPQHAVPRLLPMAWTTALDPDQLSHADRLRWSYAADSECGVPKPGATGSASLQLDPEAWYEVYVLAKAANSALADGRLPGVTFRTSRWRTPRAMLAGLGFPTADEPSPAGLVVGDLLVNTPESVGSGFSEGDQEYQRALSALGLEGWPLATTPRLSRLWVRGTGAGWLLAGLMIESPEPIHRPGRLVVSLALESAAGGETPFDIGRRDRCGSRLIYLAHRPFQVNDPLGGFAQFVLKARSWLGAEVTDLRGLSTVPRKPAFWEDPS
ncbi:hypothetical protein [Brooklawnia sp.]|uniref:hypothetical protein n=1 Tax=Brooklawnia sp. TaxID=2699740 RepID=UPI00311FB78E